MPIGESSYKLRSSSTKSAAKLTQKKAKSATSKSSEVASTQPSTEPTATGNAAQSSPSTTSSSPRYNPSTSMNTNVESSSTRVTTQAEPVPANAQGQAASPGYTSSDANKTPLVNAHRLPAPKQGNPDGAAPPPRPIIVRFAFMEDRNRLLDSFERSTRKRPVDADHRPDQQATQQPQQDLQPPQAPANRFDRVTIRSDLPPEMKRERGRLATLAYKIRKDKQLSTRIRINGINLYLQTRKRATSGSPQSPWINWDE